MDIVDRTEIVFKVIKDILAEGGINAMTYDKPTDLALDSLDKIELVMAIEDEFNIIIDDDVTERMLAMTLWDTAKEVATYAIDFKLAAKSAPTKRSNTIKKPEKTYLVRGFNFAIEPSFNSPVGVIEDKDTFKELVVNTQAEAITTMLADNDIATMSIRSICDCEDPIIIVGEDVAADALTALQVIDLKITLSLTDKLEVRAIKSDLREILKHWAEKSRVKNRRGFRSSAIKTPTFEYGPSETVVKVQVILSSAIIYSSTTVDVTPQTDVVADVALLEKRLFQKLGSIVNNVGHELR
jgi:acyl carrier protein